MDWKPLLAYITATVDQELLLRNEYLMTENLFGERSLWHALTEYITHYHTERPHQGKGNSVLMPVARGPQREGAIQCHARLGGLLKYYCRDAA